ncbi:cytochrome P450 71A1-like [Iris pallida]|uniref:Cytochrome P450 71A1-like n=1 Tax=Iris pallida TaxID=29817 RepID=A0AAX6HF93_IRIPA|nr:cytochrome P450 71A1-like [Iris pallida]
MSPLTLLPQLLHRTLLSHPILTSILFLPPLLLLSLTLSSFCKPTTPKSGPKQPRLPPCPPKLPILGNLHQLGPLPHRSLDLLSKKYGPIMLLQLGRAPTLIVSTPELAREIMKEQDHKFATRPSLTFPRKLLYAGRDIAFAPYGEYWRQARKISVLHLLSNRRVLAYRAIREEEVSIMVDQISASSSLGPVNVSKALNTLAKDFVARVTVGKHARDEMGTDAVGELIEETASLLGAFHWSDYVPWLAWMGAITGADSRANKAFRDGNKFMEHVIETRKKVLEQEEEKEESNVFIDILLSLEKDLNRHFHFDKENIKAIIEDIFGAGTDSTYIVMDWVMAELVRNPEAMKKLKEEIRDVVGSRTTVTEDDLINMSYLKAVIKETLRLHPPGPLLVPRELMEDTEIQGYHVPKGTRAFANIWTIGRDPEVWDSPDEFRPERFGGHDPIDFMGHDFELLPFGAGRRMCPGIQFAIPIIELAVANLMHQFDWKLPNAMEEGEMDMMEAPGLTCRRKVKLQLLATPCYCK